MRKSLPKSLTVLFVIGSLAMFGSAAKGGVGGKAGAPGQNKNQPPVVAFASIAAGDINAGGNNTCGVLTNGTVACWGNNFYGQTGGTPTGYVFYDNGTWEDDAVTASPHIVAGLSSVSKVSVGGYNACAISNSALYCWGSNQLGQLGQGTPSYDANPTPVLVNLPNVSDVKVGGQGVCAISNGALYCWGSVVYGVSTPSPTIYAGTLDSVIPTNTPCTITAGIIYCSGQNLVGELGNGTTNYLENPPTQVSNITTAVSVTGGLNHRCALTSAGEVYCWGWNWYGQLGLGTAGIFSPGVDGQNFWYYYGTTEPWIYTLPAKVIL